MLYAFFVMCIYHILFTQAPNDGHLGSLQFLGSTNKPDAINSPLYESMWELSQGVHTGDRFTGDRPHAYIHQIPPDSFAEWFCQFTSPPGRKEGSQLRAPQHLTPVSLHCPSDGQVAAHGFSLHFSGWESVWALLPIRAIQVSPCLKPLFMGFLSFFASLHWVPFLILDVVSASPGLILTSLFPGLPDSSSPRFSRLSLDIPSSTRQCPSSLDSMLSILCSLLQPPPLSCLHAYHSILIACWRPSYPSVMLAPWGYRSCLVPWSIFSSYFKGLRWRTRTNICWISEKQTHLWNTFSTSNPHLWVW